MDQESYIANIESLGSKYINGGLYSRVFSHPTDPTRAIKVGGCPSSDGWPAFAAWARGQSDKRHLPTVHHIERFNEGHTSDFYVAVMGRYKETLYERHNRACGSERERLSDVKVILRTAMDFGPKPVQVDKLNALGFEATILNTIGHIRGAFMGIYSSDLHSGNVMFDSHDQLIITDPLSNPTGRCDDAAFT